MKKLMFFALTATLLLGTASLSFAAPTVLGPTGLVIMPTAQSLDQDQVNVFVNTLKIPGGVNLNEDDDEDSVADLKIQNSSDGFGSGSSSDRLTNYGINVGIGYGIELGATASHFSGSTDTMLLE